MTEDTAKDGHRKRVAPAQRRAILLDVTEAILLERGAHSVTVESVAAGAEVTKGLIYHYFADREALLAAVLDRANERFRTHVTSMLDDGEGFVAKLRILCRVTIEPSDSYAVASKLMGVRSKSGLLEQSQARQAVVASFLLSELIQAEYALPNGLPMILAATVLSATTGYAITWPLAGWSTDEATEYLLRLVLAIIETGVKNEG